MEKTLNKIFKPALLAILSVIMAINILLIVAFIYFANNDKQDLPSECKGFSTSISEECEAAISVRDEPCEVKGGDGGGDCYVVAQNYTSTLSDAVRAAVTLLFSVIMFTITIKSESLAKKIESKTKNLKKKK